MSAGSIPLKNTRREAFCQHVSNGETDMGAYASAGFSGKSAKVNAYKLKAKEEVADRIEYLVKQRTEKQAEVMEATTAKLGLNKQWVMEKLLAIHDQAMEGEPIIAKRDDEDEIIGYRKNFAAATKAVELIGKEFGMFVTTVKTADDDPLLALIMRVQGHSLPVVKDVSQVEDDDE